MHGHSSIQMRISPKGPGTKGTIKGGVEVYDLCRSMHACVRATGTINRDRLLSYPAKCLLELCLYRMAMWLALPTAKAPADPRISGGFAIYMSHMLF